MSDTHDDRRKLGMRRGRTRRMYDMFYGKATEEERKDNDRLLMGMIQRLDERLQERRSGTDRREDD